MFVRTSGFAPAVALIAALCGPAAAPAATSTNICIATTGSNGWCGDGGPATKAKLALPRDVAPLPDGGYLIADSLSHVIRRVSASGTITTVAGTGVAGFPSYGDSAAASFLGTPSGVAPLPGGGYLIADERLGEVLRVTPDGHLVEAAGHHPGTGSGDGGPATAARLESPRDVAVLPDGAYVIADAGDNRVRLVLWDGRIFTLAGTGVAGFSGDGGPAAQARMNQPTAVSVARDGSVLVADRANGRIRRIGPDGTITTVAGGGFGDRSSLQATLRLPTGVTATANGGLLVAEAAVVRKVTPEGSIEGIAGSGEVGFNVLGAPARAVALANPNAIAALPDGRALVADTLNDRIRLLDPRAATLATVAGRGVPGPAGTPQPAPTVTIDVPSAPTHMPRLKSRDFRMRSSVCAAPNDPDPVAFSDFYTLPHGKRTLKVGVNVKFKIQVSVSARIIAGLTHSGTVVKTLQQDVKPSSSLPLAFEGKVKPGSYRLELRAMSHYGKRCARVKVTVKK